MTKFHAGNNVGELVGRHPELSRYFEKIEIDSCRSGRQTLKEVCREKGLDIQVVLAGLEEVAPWPKTDRASDIALMSLTELADHIEQTHHAYLRKAFRRLDSLTEQVANSHGKRDNRLHRVQDTYQMLVNKLVFHMLKEEQVLFRLIRSIDKGETPYECDDDTLGDLIRLMELEHDEAENDLDKLRKLTDNYTPPDWANDKYREMMMALAQLESDMQVHVYKEDNVLFPRALRQQSELEETRSR
jgi:regulator of cell morphogenesis and NO signaling